MSVTNNKPSRYIASFIHTHPGLQSPETHRGQGVKHSAMAHDRGPASAKGQGTAQDMHTTTPAHEFPPKLHRLHRMVADVPYSYVLTTPPTTPHYDVTIVASGATSCALLLLLPAPRPGRDFEFDRSLPLDTRGPRPGTPTSPSPPLPLPAPAPAAPNDDTDALVSRPLPPCRMPGSGPAVTALPLTLPAPASAAPKPDRRNSFSPPTSPPPLPPVGPPAGTPSATPSFSARARDST